VPQLDYALVAEHVRVEGGLGFITAANIDTLAVNETPAAWNLAFFLGFRIGADEQPGQIAPVELVLRNAAGERLIEVQGAVTVPERPADLPPEWPLRSNLALNIGFIAPDFGVYYFDVVIDDQVARTLPLRVVAAAQPDATT
jgi:Family of unknown function (DUF6941)